METERIETQAERQLRLMQEHIERLQDENAKMMERNMQLLQAIDPTAFTTTATAEPPAIPTAPTNPNPPPSVPQPTLELPKNRKTPKVNEPRIFEGKASQVNSFIKDLRLYITVKADQFEEERVRMAFILSYCRGPLVDDWTIYMSEAINEGNPGAPTDANDLIQMLKEQFGDPDETVTAQQKLDALRQTATVEEYVVQFRTLAKKTGYDETALIAAFKKGLNRQILGKIYGGLTLPKSLNEWIIISTRLDRQWRDFQRISTGGTAKTTSSRPTTIQPHNANAGGQPSNERRLGTGIIYGGVGQPMNVDRSRVQCTYCGKFGHLVDKCRRKLGLCMRCGGAGHLAKDCTRGPMVRQVTQESDEDANIVEITDNQDFVNA
jgi:hypothetical protein